MARLKILLSEVDFRVGPGKVDHLKTHNSLMDSRIYSLSFRAEDLEREVVLGEIHLGVGDLVVLRLGGDLDLGVVTKMRAQRQRLRHLSM
jgi:hypothetical protein